jgi:hypothetical protein
MNEHPILFSGPMVRAILEGQKTQTRRLIRMEHTKACVWKWPEDSTIPYAWIECGNEMSGHDYRKPCPCICERRPYGNSGDLLWVRETWCETDEGIAYRADQWMDCPSDNEQWRPSIFMPREYSRLTLHITEVRIQRIQEMSAIDIMCEGAPVDALGYDGAIHQWFRETWNSINGKRAPWESDPWVWAISFERVKS